MNLLDKKIEEKLKFFEEYDKNISSSSKLHSRIHQKKNSSEKIKENIKKNNTNKNQYEHIYSDFEYNQKNSNSYYNNYSGIVDLMYSSNPINKSKLESEKKNTQNLKEKIIDISSDIKNIQIKKVVPKTNKNKNNNKKKIFQMEGTLPKPDIIDRLLKYGLNLKKKKEMLKAQSDQVFKNMANYSFYSKNKNNISLNKDKLFEKSLYNKSSREEYDEEKKKKNEKEKENINNNCTFKPTISKKSLEIANKLEPSTTRLFKKKTNMDKKEIEKLAADNYKNLFLNNSYHNRHTKRKSKENGNRSVNKLYNEGLENIKKRELKFQENNLKKNEIYKKYPFHPKTLTKSHKSTNIKQINENLYKKPFKRKTQKRLEYSKQKEIMENSYMSECTFKPNIIREIKKDDVKMIKKYMKNMNNYVEKKRKKIEEDKKNVNKSFNGTGHKNYGFSLKDLYYDPVNSVNNGIISKKESPYLNMRKIYNTKRTYMSCKNSMDCVIPPHTKRIFCYYNENGELNSSLRSNHFNNEDYSKYDFIEAINALHNEIGNLNI